MEIKILSNLAKVFPDEICNGYEIESVSCLKNGKTSFQIAVKTQGDENLTVSSPCKGAKIHSIGFVPVGLAGPKERDDYFLRDAKSGDYPDILLPFDGTLSTKANEWTALWVELAPCGKKTGEKELTFNVGEREVKVKLTIEDAELRDQSLMCTHWFHTDCLASHYGVEIFSEEHWRIIENFMKYAVENGINIILTPLFTPPLDTEVGGERPTVQLVDVKRPALGVYEFSFDKLKRWIDMAERCGVKYFEMSHLFTQWGASHAPKIMAQTPSGYKRIFGWETNAHAKAYTNFLRAFAPKLIAFLKEEGIADRCIFHSSDEPSKKDYFSYKKATKIVRELFGEFKIIDALSEFAFYKRGLVHTPVTGIEEIEKFAGNVPELWTYYCCNPSWGNMPNRFIAMPSLRSRVLGFLMYKYDVKGFLHWGYNFYYTQYSKAVADPYKMTDAGGAFSSGDSYVVYPAPDGTPYSSLRLSVFREAIEDFEALRLLEKKIGREATLKILQDGLEKELTVRVYPHSEKWLIEKRKEINKLLAQ